MMASNCNTNNFRILFLLWTCSAGLTMATVMSGTRGVSQPHRRLDKKPPSRRECKMDADRDTVEFECKAKTVNTIDGSEKRGEEIKDKIEYKISQKERGLTVKVEYEQEIETEEMETETETQFDVFFTSLVEYVKTGSNYDEGYDWEEDEVIQTINLPEKMSFSDIIDDEDGITSSFYAEPQGADELGASFKFTVSRAGEGENKVTANKIKIDFRLVDFPWTRDDSYVALITSLESKKEVEVEYDDDKDYKKDDSSSDRESPSLKSAPHMPKDIVIPFGDDTMDKGALPFGEYTWAKTALAKANETETAVNETVLPKEAALLAEPATISVVATSPRVSAERRLADQKTKTKTHQDIAFSFVGDAAHRASEIFWDPEAGVGYGTSGVPAILSSMGAMFGAISVFLLL